MKISRTYSRSESFKRPNGTEMWIRHEASITGDVDNLELLSNGFKEMNDIVMAEVSSSIKEEKAKITAALSPKANEPFPGRAPSISDLPKSV